MRFIAAGEELPWELPDPLPRGVSRGDDGVVFEEPGLFYLDRHLLVVFPRCFRSHLGADDFPLDEAIQLIRVLYKYTRQGRASATDEQDVEETPEHYGEPDVLARIEAALWLHADFRRNGLLYVARERVSPRVRGATHWPRTLRQSRLLITPRDALFDAPVRRRRTLDPGDPLTIAHMQTVREAHRLLGIQWNGSLDGHYAAAQVVSVLNRTAHQRFADRERTVASWMRRFAASGTAVHTTQSSPISVVFATRFAFIWEAALRVALGATNPRLPKGRYEGPGVNAEGLRPVLDILLAQGEHLFVIDAKHYDVDSWPKSESINKQIVYRWLLSDMFNDSGWKLERIHNVFVKPEKSVDERIAHRASHDVVGERESSAPFGRITCLAADYGLVMDRYLRGTSDPELPTQLAELTTN